MCTPLVIGSEQNTSRQLADTALNRRATSWYGVQAGSRSLNTTSIELSRVVAHLFRAKPITKNLLAGCLCFCQRLIETLSNYSWSERTPAKCQQLAERFTARSHHHHLSASSSLDHERARALH